MEVCDQLGDEESINWGVECKVELFCGGRCGGAQPVTEEREEGGVVGS